ncbi:MAG: NAD(P)H nitroreductase [Nitrospirae bacterium]|nr:MAG: NAD(P)H nitroreductase [Nitrospirota bacterium]
MLEAIRKRRSIRNYQSREVEEDKLKEILKAAMFSPTAWGKRPWEFIIVKEQKTKEALSETTPYAGFVKDAPLVIVIIYDVTRGRRFKEDSSICAEHIHLEAVNQGLGSCFVQVADSDGPHGPAENYVKQLLGIPENYRVQCMMPIGYPEKELPEHSDDEYDESKIHHGKFSS